MHNRDITSNPIANGTRLGAYEIVAPIGAGGMGEVYRARDTRLERSVAIKILPPEFAANASLKARFEREARTVSALSHPNICPLFDVGESGDRAFLVMELLEGRSLADRLARGALPLDQVLKVGFEIASALGYAHRQGIIHRDLKPGNIMLTKSGAKLVDFGLAKSAAAFVTSSTEGMTAQKPITEQGTMVGTFQYMAPEQLEGADSDHRTDIFALGAVLYEMVTGRRAFDGKTRTSVIAAVISSVPPPISTLQPLTPRALEQLIRSCLEKDPDTRIQSAHDVALQLRWMADASDTASVRKGRSWLPWAAAALAGALGIAAGAMYFNRAQPAHQQSVRFNITAPPGTAIDGVPAISPDGRQIVFRTRTSSSYRDTLLWLRSVDSLDARPLKGTEGAHYAFWSPDSKHIGFMTSQRMSRIDVAEGKVQLIHEPVDSPAGGATWAPDDTIIFTPRFEGNLFRVPARGGRAVPLPATASHAGAGWPWLLPDGDHLLYLSEGKSPGSGAVYVTSLKTAKPELLLAVPANVAISRPAYANGYVFYLLDDSLYAHPFDVAKLELSGEPIKIEDDVQHAAPARASFSVAENGMIAFRKKGPALVSQLSFADREGRKAGTLGPLAAYGSFSISPDGQRIACNRHDDNPSVWVMDVARGTSTRVAFETWSGFGTWLPDSRSMVYAAAVDSPPEIFLRRPNGSTTRLTRSGLQNYTSDVTPDGRLAIYNVGRPGTGYDIYAVPIAPPHDPFPIANSRFREEDADVSPDGRWIAYSSNESGTSEVYAMPFPNGGSRVQVSSGGGLRSRWSRDGAQLFYVQPSDNNLMAARMKVAASGEMEPSVPERLFVLGAGLYDVMPDGRFVVSDERVNEDSPGITVVTGWRGGR